MLTSNSNRSDWPPDGTTPQWLTLGDSLMGPVMRETNVLLESNHRSDTTLQQLALLTLYHFQCTMSLSIEANRKGMHTASMGLARHVIEAITVIEIALPCSNVTCGTLFKLWSNGKISLGNIRKKLAQDVWIRYGTGLWDEQWETFFGNLTAALQPYAHCTSHLMQWGLALFPSDARSGRMYCMPGAYDSLKASRITLLHMLLLWTLGRLVTLSGASLPQICELGYELGKSSLLFEHQTDWQTQFAPHMVFFHSGES